VVTVALVLTRADFTLTRAHRVNAVTIARPYNSHAWTNFKPMALPLTHTIRQVFCCDLEHCMVLEARMIEW